MEIIARLESKFDEMLSKISALEEENQRLKALVEQETDNRRQVQERIERLLERIEGQSG
jgi:cell division protein ZapB